jgi:4-amino-4-deoxy-L-arabinose transferase-like glycosyltransferase
MPRGHPECVAPRPLIPQNFRVSLQPVSGLDTPDDAERRRTIPGIVTAEAPDSAAAASFPDPRAGGTVRMRLQRSPLAGLVAIVGLYLVLRVLVLLRTVLFEDHDSLGYLRDLEAIRSWNLHLLTPDSLPGYPAAAALVSMLGLGDVTAARLTSVLFSLLLLAALYGIGRRLAPGREVLVGLLFLSVSPFLVTLSIGVLAEPTYVALVYGGLWLFWTQYREPSWPRAALLGAVFSLAFLTRVEGLFYLALLPLLQAAALAVHARLRTHWRVLVPWSAAYATMFVLVAAPQIARVSSQMGEPALNGRQVWSALVSQGDGRTQEEKVYGLEYSPTEINLRFLQSQPDARRALTSEASVGLYGKRAVLTFDDIVRSRVGRIVGPVFFGFFLFGMLALYRRGHRLELGMILLFLGAALVGPLLQEPLLDRHLVVVVPIVLLLAGIGAVDAADRLASSDRGRSGFRMALIAAALVTVVVPLREAFSPPMENWEYSPARLAGPLAVLAAQDQPADRRPRILTRTGYIAHFSGADFVFMPHTDLDGLTRYMSAQYADYLFLEHKHVRGRAFFAAFLADEPPAGFERIYRGRDEWGDVLELYRFNGAHGSVEGGEVYVAPWSTARRFYP